MMKNKMSRGFLLMGALMSGAVLAEASPFEWTLKMNNVDGHCSKNTRALRVSSNESFSRIRINDGMFLSRESGSPGIFTFYSGDTDPVGLSEFDEAWRVVRLDMLQMRLREEFGGFGKSGYCHADLSFENPDQENMVKRLIQLSVQ